MAAMLWPWLARHGPGSPDRPRFGVLFVTANLNVGGAQRSLVNLLCAWPAPVPAAVAVMGPCACDDHASRLAAVGILLEPVTAARRIDRISGLLDLVEARGVATVCFWNADPAVKLAVSRVLAGGPVRLVDVSPGPMLLQELDSARQAQWLLAWSRADYLGALTGFVAKYAGGLPEGLPAGRGTVIPNGVPMPPPAPAPPRPALLPAGFDARLAVVTACRMVPSKRVGQMVDVAAALARRVPGASLTLIGGPEPRHLAYWEAVRARAGPSAHFAGPHHRPFAALAGFRAFAMLSVDQGCPNASLEAMAMGLPVVANNDGGTAEQVVDGATGFLVPGDDPEAMAARLAALLADPALAARLGAAGRARARDLFSLDRMVQAYRALLAPDEGGCGAGQARAVQAGAGREGAG